MADKALRHPAAARCAAFSELRIIYPARNSAGRITLSPSGIESPGRSPTARMGAVIWIERRLGRHHLHQPTTPQLSPAAPVCAVANIFKDEGRAFLEINEIH